MLLLTVHARAAALGTAVDGLRAVVRRTWRRRSERWVELRCDARATAVGRREVRLSAARVVCHLLLHWRGRLGLREEESGAA